MKIHFLKNAQGFLVATFVLSLPSASTTIRDEKLLRQKIKALRAKVRDEDEVDVTRTPEECVFMTTINPLAPKATSRCLERFVRLLEKHIVGRHGSITIDGVWAGLQPSLL